MFTIYQSAHAIWRYGNMSPQENIDGMSTAINNKGDLYNMDSSASISVHHIRVWEYSSN